MKEVANAPEKIGGAFRELNGSLRLSNDELQVANDRLANDIAKLEGHRQNTLALALDEARLAADKLAESLQKDLSSVDKLLREQAGTGIHGFFTQLFGQAGLSDVAKEIGGETGFGGFRGRIAGLTGSDLSAAYTSEIARFNSELGAAERYQASHASGMTGMGPLGGFQNDQKIFGDMTARIEALRAVLAQLREQAGYISLTTTNAALQKRKDDLTAGTENATLDKPFNDRMAALGAQLDGIKAKAAAIGAPESVQVLAKAFGEAQKAIEEVNKALEKNHTQLTENQKQQVRDIELNITS